MTMFLSQGTCSSTSDSSSKAREPAPNFPSPEDSQQNCIPHHNPMSRNEKDFLRPKEFQKKSCVLYKKAYSRIWSGRMDLEPSTSRSLSREVERSDSATHHTPRGRSLKRTWLLIASLLLDGFNSREQIRWVYIQDHLFGRRNDVYRGALCQH